MLPGVAFAADIAPRMYTKAAVDPGYNWTGFYAGLNAGGAWGNFKPASTMASSGASYFDPVTAATFDAAAAHSVTATGFTGGGQIGYNWQLGNMVFGLEADFESLRLSGKAASVLPPFSGTAMTISSSVQTDWLFTARPRIGIASGNALFYATGGVAVTQLKGNFHFTDSGGTGGRVEDAAFSNTKVGWTVGGGIEAGLSGNWTVRAEYLYVDFGKVSTTGTITGGTSSNVSLNPLTHSSGLQASIVRSALNYRF
ncbi:MAG: porin family protein [Afipia sp.]|nr:porin family protein [Afipia sp.]